MLTKRAMRKKISRKRWLQERYYRDNRCHYCRAHTYLFDGPLQATVDHKVPQSVMHWNHHSNYLLACRTCNMAKAATSYDEFVARRDRDASLAENAERSSGEAVAARAEGIAQGPEA